jgi:hypothetical protein
VVVGEHLRRDRLRPARRRHSSADEQVEIAVAVDVAEREGPALASRVAPASVMEESPGVKRPTALGPAAGSS